MRCSEWLVRAVFVLALLPGLVGCRENADRFTGQFEVVALAEAPAELQVQFEHLKVVPGLFALRTGTETYVLLLAGPAQEPGDWLEVYDVRRPVGKKREVRILATVLPGQGSDEYMFSVIRLATREKLTFHARVTSGGTMMNLGQLPLDETYGAP